MAEQDRKLNLNQVNRFYDILFRIIEFKIEMRWVKDERCICEDYEIY